MLATLEEWWSGGVVEWWSGGVKRFGFDYYLLLLLLRVPTRAHLLC